MKPLVSVVLTTYNRSNLLMRAIESVLNQTYENFECIVINDASTDDTVQVLRQISDKRVRYFSHKTNLHLSACRNTGIENATGELIAFLDDDDTWLPKKLDKQVALMQGMDPELGLVYCWTDVFLKDRKIRENHPILRGRIFPQTLAGQPIGNGSTLLIPATVVKNLGGFDESLRRGIDGDFIRRVCHQYKVDFVPEVLVYYYVGHPDRITTESLSGIRAARRGEEAKLVKFKKELNGLPHIHAVILKEISRHCLRLDDFATVDRHLLQVAKLEQTRFLWAIKGFLLLPTPVRIGFYRLFLLLLTIRSWARKVSIFNVGKKYSP